MTRLVLTPTNHMGQEIRDFRTETVGLLPTPDSTQAGRTVFHTGLMKVCISDGAGGYRWMTVGEVGAPPSGPAGGDLSGTFPNPQIATGVIVDSDVSPTAGIQQSKVNNLVTDLTAKANAATSLTAGAGLTGGGTLAGNRQFDVGAGPGIIVGTDTVSADTTYLQVRSQKGVGSGYASLDVSAKVPLTELPTGTTSSTVATGDHVHSSLYAPLTRQIISGSGLTGGGDLSANRTINFVGDSTLNVSADQVSVASAPKWTTARTVSLTGDVTGSVSLDGSNNVTLVTTVVSNTGSPKFFAGNVGSGSSVVVTHLLGTRDVITEVYRLTSPYDKVYCDVEHTDANNITLKFASPVSANAFRVVVQGR